MRFPVFLACAAMLALSAPAPAQQIATVQAGAGGRHELRLDPRTRIAGLKPAQAAAFRADVAKLTDYLRALPAVANPPDPVCMRLASWIEMSALEQGTAAAIIDAHMPISFDKGRCHAMTITGVAFHVNHPSTIFTNDRMLSSGELRGWLLPIESVGERLVHFAGKEVLVVRPGRLPWRPVPRRAWLANAVKVAADHADQAEQAYRDYVATAIRLEGKAPRRTAADDRMQAYPRERLRTLRAELERPTSATWVCIATDGTPSPDDDCPESRVLVEPNPDYWDRARPERIQLLGVRTPAGNVMQESKDKYAARMAVWRTLDWRVLADLVLP